MLAGNWNQFKGKLRQRWGQLSEDDVAQFQGNVDVLVGLIQRKTGEGRGAVEGFLQDLTESAWPTVGNAAETASQYAQQAAQSVQESVCRAADHVHEHLSEVRGLVRDRPGESLFISFGAGVLAGVLLTISLRGK